MLILILLSPAARFVPDFIATNLVLLIAILITAANFSVVLRVQIVLVVHEVVHAAIVAVELLIVVVVELLMIIAASDAAIDDVCVDVVVLMLQVRHLVALATVVEEYWIGDGSLALALDRRQVLKVMLAG